jgi:hypothetical protein
LNALEEEMFGSFKPLKEASKGLRDTIRLMFMKNFFDESASTVLIAGMDEAEAHYLLEKMADLPGWSQTR